MRTPKFITSLAVIMGALLGAVTHAQPLIDTLNVQGYLQKANGQAVTNGTYHIAFGVEQNSVFIWGQELNLQVTNGLFNAPLAGPGADLTGLPVASGINADFHLKTLNPAALMAAGAGEISVHVYTVDAIDGNSGLNFDVPLGAVPTAMIASTAISVAPLSVTLAGLATSAYTNTAVGATAGQLVALNGSGLINPNFLPTFNSAGGQANGGTGSANGSIVGAGNLTYASGSGFTTTLGDNTSSSSVLIRSGTGGISETVTGATGNMTYTAGATSGNITLLPGTGSGSLSIGSASSSGASSLGNGGGASTTNILAGTGGILMQPVAPGLVRISQGGINLINGAQSVTVNSPPAMGASYSMNLPLVIGNAGQFFTTDGSGNSSWTSVLNPTGNMTIGAGNTTALVMSPAGMVTISPSAGGLVMNPTGSLTLGAGSTTGVTINPSSGNAPVTIAAAGSGNLTIGAAAGTGSVLIGNAAANSITAFNTGTNGGFGFGTTTPAAGLDLTLTGTFASAVILPRDTGANRPSVPVNGMIRYNKSIGMVDMFQAGTWVNPITTVSVQQITASTTYVPTTAGLQYAIIEMVGGGAGGGGAGATAGMAAAGGGAGGYIKVLCTAAQLAGFGVITIPAVAGGGAAGANNGTIGGNVTMTVSGGTLTATGGAIGTAGSVVSTNVAGGLGGVPTVAGACTTIMTQAGGAGFSSVSTAAAGTANGGTGGTSFFGAGGLGKAGAAGAGLAAPATSFGAGGGGGTGVTQAGGAGTKGVVIITEYRSF